MIIQWAMAIETYNENSKLNGAPLKLTTRVAKAHPRTNCQDQYYLDIMTLKIQIREFFQKYHQQGSHILHCCLNFGFQCLELCLEQLNSLVVFIGMSCGVPYMVSIFLYQFTSFVLKNVHLGVFRSLAVNTPTTEQDGSYLPLRQM